MGILWAHTGAIRCIVLRFNLSASVQCGYRVHAAMLQKVIVSDKHITLITLC